MPDPVPTNTAALDSAVVLATLLIVGAGLAALATLPIPDKNLPIFASILTGLMSLVVGGYAGFRWGSSVTAKKLAGTQEPGE